MDKESIKFSDWERILFGNVPIEFLLEALIRTLIIYTILLVVVRISGKRMSGQLTNTEMAVMLVLGAIVSAAMQMPERGLLQGCFLLFLILLFQQVLSTRMRIDEKLESVIQGRISILVKNGVMELKEMKKQRISRQQLFAVLRNQEVFQLGEVKRMYLESCGTISIYKQKPAKAGLSVHEFINEQPAEEKVLCSYCGKSRGENEQRCEQCEHEEWVKAVNGS